MTKLFELFKRRYSVRSFKEQKIAPSKLEKIFLASSYTPSAGNLQAYKVLRIQTEGNKTRLAAAAFNQNFIAQAPIVLVFMADPTKSSKKYGLRGRDLYCIQDATIAATFTWLTAVELGLGAAWVGAFDEQEVKSSLGMPDSNLIPVIVMPIGYENVIL